MFTSQSVSASAILPPPLRIRSCMQDGKSDASKVSEHGVPRLHATRAPGTSNDLVQMSGGTPTLASVWQICCVATYKR